MPTQTDVNLIKTIMHLTRTNTHTEDKTQMERKKWQASANTMAVFVAA